MLAVICHLHQDINLSEVSCLIYYSLGSVKKFSEMHFLYKFKI